MNNETTFRIIVLAIFILVISIRGYYARKVKQFGEKLSPSKESIEREGELSVVLRIILFYFGIAVAILYAIYPHWMTWFKIPFPASLRWIGVGLGIASLPLLVWVQHVLGRHWSSNLEVREQHTLVTSGPYRLVRHPMYTVFFALMISFSLVSANWLIMLPSMVAIIVIFVRIGNEEIMMIKQFGNEYRIYMKQTGQLLPRLFR